MVLTTLVCIMASLVVVPDLSSGYVTTFMGPYNRTNLSLTLIIKYPEQELTSRGLKTDLFLVGNGLGLFWDSPQKLNKVETDTWQWDFLIKITPDGLSCQDCVDSQTLPLGKKLEYRVNTDRGYDMIGANFGTELPLSKMSPYFRKPVVRNVYPYFFTSKGTMGSLIVTSDDEAIASRNWTYFLPSSFAENTYKKYPIAWTFDVGVAGLKLLGTYIDDQTVKYALAEESVLIGTEDYRPLPNMSWDGQGDRFVLLNPTVGINLVCNEGNLTDRCNGCIPLNATDLRGIEDCGRMVKVVGKGNEFIDYFLKQVVPAVNNVTSDRLLTDRYHTAVAGCSLGGQMACHTIWTRPDAFFGAACQSSSFWWPTTDSGYNGFYFLNVTLKNHTGPREPQRVYIDVSNLEDESYFGMVSAALEVVDVMTASSPQFVLDKTITLSVVTGQEHGAFECLSRIWMYNNKLFPAEGGPRNPISKSKRFKPDKKRRRAILDEVETEAEEGWKDWSKEHFVLRQVN